MVINVGNLAAGGTGKSPMLEYLVRLLHKKYALATLSRGYKRATKGFRMADEYTGVREIGDEPYQFYLKFGMVATISVGEERALAIPKILLEHPETQVIIMDDAYQHRTVRADFNILMTTYDQPFYHDFLLPSGRLREPRRSAKRAQAIIISKCPESMSHEEKAKMVNRVKKYAGPTKQVFFTSVKYGQLKCLTGTISSDGPMVGFAGLADNRLFRDHIEQRHQVKDFIEYDDHHQYNDEEIDMLVSLAKQHQANLITTEKDVVKFRNEYYIKRLGDVKLYYIPIMHRFHQNGNVFDALVQEAIDDKYLVEN